MLEVAQFSAEETAICFFYKAIDIVHFIELNNISKRCTLKS